MSGNDKLLVDTNIFIYLDGGSEKAAESLLGKDLYLSFITEIELLGSPKLTNEKQLELQEMIAGLVVLDFSLEIKQVAIAIKQKRIVKTPDAIIAATAIVLDLPLLTSDKGFMDIEGLNYILFEA